MSMDSRQPIQSMSRPESVSIRRRGLATFKAGGKVALLLNGNYVGTAYLMGPGPDDAGDAFRRSLHSHHLSKYETPSQFLVAITTVTVDESVQHIRYPYKYGGIEPPPPTLSGLTTGIHVWDLRNLIPCDDEIMGVGGDLKWKCNSGSASAGVEEGRPGKAGNSCNRKLVSRHAHASPSRIPFRMNETRLLTRRSGMAGRRSTAHVQSFSEQEEVDVNSQSSEENNDFSEDESYVCNERVKDGSKNVKRKYTYRNREKAKDEEVCALVAKRKKIVEELSVEKLRKKKCCERNKCFKNADIRFLAAQMKRVLLMSQSERRDLLTKLLDTRTRRFAFNGKLVRATFLQEAFGFSRDLQCTVKGTPLARPASSASFLPKYVHAEKRESIASFLERLAETCADSMPDRNEKHLPYFSKDDVYSTFCEEYEELYGAEEPVPSRPYFYEIWRAECSNIKVRRVSRFAKCGVCENLRSMLAKAGRNPVVAEELRRQKAAHNAQVAAERLQYKKNTDMAKLQPNNYCSLIIDGADQSAFGLPHFPVSSKDSRGHALGVKLIGVLEHSMFKRLSLFTMTEQYATGANHIVECLHRVLNSRILRAPLPRTLFIQLDNCSRENKNRYLFAYLECLVAWGVVCEVYASFLPVGHTHSDIDQAFSCTARRLRSRSAITLKDMMAELASSYTPEPTVTHMRGVANFSGLCDQEKCLKPAYGMTRFRYFHFLRRDGEPELGEDLYATTCLVRATCEDDWVPLRRNDGAGFIYFVPDITKTPATVTKSPPNLREVNNRFMSEEVRINDRNKMKELQALRDEVYSCVEESFHWNPALSIEMNGTYKRRTDGEEEIQTEDTSNREPILRAEYELNEYVAIRNSEGNINVPFWVARITDLERNENGVIVELGIHWYEVTRGKNAYQAKYDPSSLPNGSEREPWLDKVSTNCVLHSFRALTRNKTIPVHVQIGIRQVLN